MIPSATGKQQAPRDCLSSSWIERKIHCAIYWFLCDRRTNQRDAHRAPLQLLQQRLNWIRNFLSALVGRSTPFKGVGSGFESRPPHSLSRGDLPMRSGNFENAQRAESKRKDSPSI